MLPRPDDFAPFEPHPLIRGGHAQTLAGLYLPGRSYPYRACRHRVPLEDGDTLVLHDDRPPLWQPGDRTALLMHGLAGCHLSPYMVRVAGKLNEAGVRTFRMDLRGCGAGEGLARLPYHAGRSEDALAALRWISERCPESAVCLIGFSLSGNISLKLLGEGIEPLPENLVRAVAVNPSIDLFACSERFAQPGARLYDRHFVGLLCRQLSRRARLLPEAGTVRFDRRPRRLLEFDDRFTAPASGFRGVEEYYARCSAMQFIPDIRIPTLILASRDDPLIPVGPFEKLRPPPMVTLHISVHGGHLGFLGRAGIDADRRWMDWRIIQWVLAADTATERLVDR